MKKIYCGSIFLFLYVSLLAQQGPAPMRLKETYAGCSNIVYDKIPGANNRSATECEVQYDLKVKRVINTAFKQAIADLELDHWKTASATNLAPIDQVDRHSEEYPSKLGSYDIDMQLDQSSAGYATWYKKYTDAVAASNYQKLAAAMYEIKGNTSARITVRINNNNTDIYNFKTEHKVLQVPGAVYAVQCGHTASLSGGDIESSMDATFIFIGKWKPATIVKNSDGTENIRLNGIINRSVPTLGVQNILIRMECSYAVAQSVLKKLDIQKLLALVK